MLDLFNPAIKHLPKLKIPAENMLYLGYSDNYDVRLVVEEWEFRVYNYEYWSWDSITDGEHEDEDWWANIENYFGNGWDCFDKDTCEYVPIKFETDIPLDMASEIILACDNLEEVGHRVSEEWLPTDDLITFLKAGLIKIWMYNNTLVYCYYK